MLTEEPLHPRPLDRPGLLVPKHDDVRRRLAVREGVAELRHLVGRVGRLRRLDARQPRLGRHLDVDGLARPVPLRLVKDGLVEGEHVAKVGVGPAAPGRWSDLSGV